MSDTSEPVPVPVPVPLGETRGFWILMGYALLLGLLGAVAGLVFLGVTGAGNNWYDVSDPGWFGGQWWWVAVTAGAGVVVGLLHSLTRLPAKIPGLIADIEGGHVDTGLVPGIVAVSAVSLIGGASLGPEQALGAMGGGAATWMARREGLDKALKREGLTVLLCEQNLHFARAVSDRAVILEKGRVRWQGAMEALMNDEAARRQYLSV